ncbi:zona pellucida sperm-binding protein 3 isoform X2 [Lates calcarifer]|uniref:Zona pellucida glycoprotein 3c n=1 Tax=Lates calcarifer TaxID=8187 RepID=A0A4W6C2D2_LATCA|nr:zona pellucida sperm-binding protein 3 isoform X2 [Lates calcarifer]
MKMGLLHTGLLLLLFCSVYSYQFKSRAGYGLFVQDPELEWGRMETVIGEEMSPAPAPKAKIWKSASNSGSSTPEAKKFPEYVRVESSKYPKTAFKPEKGARPLPAWVKEMLLPPTVAPKSGIASGKAAVRPKLIEILCHVDRMYVRIRREIFKTKTAYKDLKLGKCPVNQGTKVHYYFLYLLKTDCGFKKENNVDYLSISNTLHYKPSSVIVREIPFDIPLQCKFPRNFHSYKIGFHPQLQGGTVYKALQPKSSVSLTPQDASGNEITGSKTYTLGQPMYFEAKRSDKTSKSGDQRMYINKCFMTASENPNSNLKYTVIDKYGCMVDGKMTDQSKFLSDSSKKIQKFSVGAFVFKDKLSSSSSSQQLYMHCAISMGKLTPTASSKACNYDPATKKWKELYGDDSVCTCCESSCPSGQSKASSNIVTSRSWKVGLSGNDGYADVDPRMKPFDADTFSWEDPDMAEHRDFLNYWEHDY